MFLETIKGQ